MCYVLFYIVDVVDSFIGYKLDNGNNNKTQKVEIQKRTT